MSQYRLPPPREEACLVRLRSSSQKGGTIVAEDVTDVATHDRRICDPDAYRPPFCPRCRGRRLHVHDYRERILLGDPERFVTKVVRHACVECTAIWQVLPAFIARHLWRSWRVVEQALTDAGVRALEWRRWPAVAGRTRRRWRARWLRPARFLLQVLATCGATPWSALSAVLAPEATCADLVAAHADLQSTPAGQRLAAVAALMYRLQPKVRLM